MKEARSFLPKFYSQLMKVAKTGVISKKTASRKISRVTKKINNSNKNIEQIISNYKPTIFWKDKEIVKQQIIHWPLKKIKNMIIKILTY